MRTLSNLTPQIERAEHVEGAAMRPYKPKTPAQLRLKTDPYHSGMRRAYKLRPPTEKMHDARQRSLYYRRNKAQLKLRKARGAQIHRT